LLKYETVENRLKMSNEFNLAKILALLSLLTPISGYSLGIGDIKLHSALNQNLDAEISLVVSTGDKASDIKVNLAPPDKFDEAGVPWSPFLSKIKFATIVGVNGSVIIKLSSRDVVKEPFLNFLLQVNWPKGSLYREFTVLLDPPAAYKKTTILASDNAESYKPEQPVISQYESIQKQPLKDERSVSGVSEYGPTNKNDTLWKVAVQVSRQVGVSVEQMMIAMYKENPYAFYRENMNALLAGKILNIPEREIILKYSQKQALAEFNRQTKVWQNRLETVSVTAASAKKETPEKQLTLVAPTEENVAESTNIVSENEQVIAKNKVDDAASKTIDKKIINIDSPINDALQSKVTELEKQLAMMQQILVLKDQQLAALQSPFQEKSVVKTTPSMAETTNQVIQQPIQQGPKPVIEPKSEVTSSTYTYYLWTGIGAGALSLLGWFWWRKRKLDEQVNNQSPYASLSMSKTPESSQFFSTLNEKDSQKNADADGKHPFFSEITFGNFDISDTYQGEIDPVSEADVYLAYGRYQQAEELMRDVIKDQPNRDEYKLKLLKIFYLNKNKYAFETYANELAKEGKINDVEFWAKVLEMGSEICKDSKLFFSKTDEFLHKEKTILEKESVHLAGFDNIEKNEPIDILEKKPAFSSFGKSVNNEGIKEIPQVIDNLLDFDFTSDKDEIIDEQKNNKSIDFDLSTFTTKNEESSEALKSIVPKIPDVNPNNEFESFDFNFESSKTEVKDVDRINSRIAEESDGNAQSTEDLTSLDSSFGNDSLDRNFYLDKTESVLNGGNVDQLGRHDDFNLTHIDEMETKLDLAKAYSDMNDTDAAKGMACQVLEKGTEEQKKEAQVLLNNLK
jgi:pilus assembly protein FimV